VTTDGITVDGWLIPDAEIEERFDTPGGPGGQHANKTQTAVTLRFDVMESSLPVDVRNQLMKKLGPVIEVKVTDTRSQWRNRETARERLAAKLDDALVERKPRKKTKPSRAAKERRLASKKARSDLKRKRRPPETD
jgi:ribosome-associated protein